MRDFKTDSYGFTCHWVAQIVKELTYIKQFQSLAFQSWCNVLWLRNELGDQPKSNTASR